MAFRVVYEDPVDGAPSGRRAWRLVSMAEPAQSAADSTPQSPHTEHSTSTIQTNDRAAQLLRQAALLSDTHSSPPPPRRRVQPPVAEARAEPSHPRAEPLYERDAGPRPSSHRAVMSLQPRDEPAMPRVEPVPSPRSRPQPMPLHRSDTLPLPRPRRVGPPKRPLRTECASPPQMSRGGDASRGSRARNLDEMSGRRPRPGASRERSVSPRMRMLAALARGAGVKRGRGADEEVESPQKEKKARRELVDETDDGDAVPISCEERPEAPERESNDASSDVVEDLLRAVEDTSSLDGASDIVAVGSSPGGVSSSIYDDDLPPPRMLMPGPFSLRAPPGISRTASLDSSNDTYYTASPAATVASLDAQDWGVDWDVDDIYDQDLHRADDEEYDIYDEEYDPADYAPPEDYEYAPEVDELDEEYECAGVEEPRRPKPDVESEDSSSGRGRPRPNDDGPHFLLSPLPLPAAELSPPLLFAPHLEQIIPTPLPEDPAAFHALFPDEEPRTPNGLRRALRLQIAEVGRLEMNEVQFEAALHDAYTAIGERDVEIRRGDRLWRADVERLEGLLVQRHALHMQDRRGRTAARSDWMAEMVKNEELEEKLKALQATLIGVESKKEEALRMQAEAEAQREAAEKEAEVASRKRDEAVQQLEEARREIARMAKERDEAVRQLATMRTAPNKRKEAPCVGSSPERPTRNLPKKIKGGALQRADGEELLATSMEA